jgi:hypothetical protein
MAFSRRRDKLMEHYEEDLKQRHEMKEFIGANKRNINYLAIEELDNSHYRIVLFLNSGAGFPLSTQKREDRDFGIREFKTVNAAVNSAKQVINPGINVRLLLKHS